jgi:para-aminobenzoate synthetase component 2
MLGELGAELEVHRNDRVTVQEIEAKKPDALVLSPGPGRPAGAGILMEAIRRFAGQIPILGVCLGHQGIGEAFGGVVVEAPSLVHGKTAEVTHDGKTIFHGLPHSFPAARYHSLVVDWRTIPDELEVSATTDDGVVMGLRHKHWPVEGVQFHPESILTKVGPQLLKNFLELVAARK